MRNSIALSAMTLAVYGFSQESIPLAATGAGLFALLHQLREAHTKEKDRISTLASQPAYVLVKAKEFAEHAQ